MAIIPRSDREMRQLHAWLDKHAALLDRDRVPCREQVDIFANLLLIGLGQRREEDEQAALETIDILLEKLTAMRRAPTVKAMWTYLVETAVRTKNQ